MSDADVIFSYTAEQAIEDGVLVEPFPKQFPKLLLTAAVYADIMETPTTQELEERGGHNQKVDDRTPAQRIIPLFQDAVLAMRAAIAKDKDEYLVTSNVLDGNITGKKLWIALNEFGGITIMFPEDY